MEITEETTGNAGVPAFNPDAVPAHIAVIMDGNGRWAASRGEPRLRGHREGARALETVMRACGDWGVRYLTVYAFSTENWKRPQAEVDGLMALLGTYLREKTPELLRDGICLRAIGDRSRLPDGTRAALARAEEELAGGGRLTLQLALNYGGRDEIVRAARALARAARAGEIAPEAIDEAAFAARLDTAGVPDPDLLIRTAGEKRLSNFLPWQLTYAEYYATPVCWPDFGRAELAAAIAEYQRRTRKFGGLGK